MNNLHMNRQPTFTSGEIGDGIVVRKSTNQYVVKQADQTFDCTLSPKLKHLESSNRRADLIALGDRVKIVSSPTNNSLIVEILPRRNKLSRRSAVPMPGAVPYEQLIAANIDQVVPVFAAASPAPKWGLLDRYLALAEAEELESLIVITKLDLATQNNGEVDMDFQTIIEEYRCIGYSVLLTSAMNGLGIVELRNQLRGKTSVMLGKSGVGKSALLNAVQPGLGLRTGAVSTVTGKGKHTTTHLEMFELLFGGNLVDTPGVREFGLWDVDGQDIAYLYKEFRPYLGRCRFGSGCHHQHEPNCSVQEAVNQGHITARRYLSYLNLRHELEME